MVRHRCGRHRFRNHDADGGEPALRLRVEYIYAESGGRGRHGGGRLPLAKSRRACIETTLASSPSARAQCYLYAGMPDARMPALELTPMVVLKRLFEQHFHSPVERAEPLRGQLGGSGRKIIRLSGSGQSAIGILYDVREENVAFLEFSRHFRRHGLPVPEIYAEDLSQGAYLEEDLGGTTLFEFLSEHRDGATIAPEAIAVYRKVVAVLPRFQVDAGRDLNYKVCYPR